MFKILAVAAMSICVLAGAANAVTLGFDGPVVYDSATDSYTYSESGYVVGNTSSAQSTGLELSAVDTLFEDNTASSLGDLHLEYCCAPYTNTFTIAADDGALFTADGFEAQSTGLAFSRFDPATREETLAELQLQLEVIGYRAGAAVADGAFVMPVDTDNPGRFKPLESFTLGDEYANIDALEFVYRFGTADELTTVDGLTQSDLLALGFSDGSGDLWDAHTNVDNVRVSAVAAEPVAPVPLPAGGVLLIGGLVLLGSMRKRA